MLLGKKLSIPCDLYINSATKTTVLLEVRNIEGQNHSEHTVSRLHSFKHFSLNWLALTLFSAQKWFFSKSLNLCYSSLWEIFPLKLDIQCFRINFVQKIIHQTKFSQSFQLRANTIAVPPKAKWLQKHFNMIQTRKCLEVSVHWGKFNWKFKRQKVGLHKVNGYA